METVQTFWTNYGVVDLFTQKTSRCGGEFRHTLAHRLYLYILHYHAGRFNQTQRKQLVKVLNTSHTALAKAIAHLEQIGLAKTCKNYVTCKSQNHIKSQFNVRFEFNLTELLDPQRFKNKLFRCRMQTIAAIYGQKKKKKNLFPCRTSDHTCTDGSEFIQRQSASYLAKMSNMCERNVQRRLTSIRKENTKELEWGYSTVDHRGFGTSYLKNKPSFHDLTEAGHCPKEKAKIKRFHSFADAQQAAQATQDATVHVKQVGIMYAVAKPKPITWKHSIPCKGIDTSRNVWWKKNIA
jgi:hypothetical protein